VRQQTKKLKKTNENQARFFCTFTYTCYKPFLHIWKFGND